MDAFSPQKCAHIAEPRRADGHFRRSARAARRPTISGDASKFYQSFRPPRFSNVPHFIQAGPANFAARIALVPGLFTDDRTADSGAALRLDYRRRHANFTYNILAATVLYLPRQTRRNACRSTATISSRRVAQIRCQDLRISIIYIQGVILVFSIGLIINCIDLYRSIIAHREM